MALLKTRLYKFNFLLLLAILTACESEEDANTEISGKVTDIETNAPVLDAKINLTVVNGIDISGFINPITTSTSTNEHGAYTFILPPNDQQILYLVTPDKKGYVEVKESNYIADQLKKNERNLHDIKLAKGTYLTLSIKKISDNSFNQTIRVKFRQLQDPVTAPQNGQLIITEMFSLNGAKVDTAVSRGFYYKHSPSLKIEWDIITNGSETTMESSSTTIELVEYGTIKFEIRY